MSLNSCLYCFSQTKNKKYCSSKCSGFDRRGKMRGGYGEAKNHIRISIGTDCSGKPIRRYLHRYIIETQVRPLKPGEVVHHKDENKFNNSLDNLEILASQAEHKALHARLDREKEEAALQSTEELDAVVIGDKSYYF